MYKKAMFVGLLTTGVLVLAGCKGDDGSVGLSASGQTGGTAADNEASTSGPGDSASESAESGDAFAGPALQTDPAELDRSLNCTAFEHPDKPPVLLIHGTTVTGSEQFTTFYTPQLVERGFDVCIVTYPDRGLGDMQVSAEYVVYALRRIHAETGRKVAMIGHSQGGVMPRWAIKFWPSAREAVADFVMLAGVNHGTDVALPAALADSLTTLLGIDRLPPGVAPAVTYQFARSSNFVAALNAGDETPGEIDYTALYTLYDELVRPVVPEPTAAVDYEQGNPKVANILLQDICPGHVSEHFVIGTADSLAFALAVDAISNDGPANVERAGGAAGLCGLLPVDLADIVMPSNAARLLEVVASTLDEPELDPHLTASEPPLMPYAQQSAKP
ncbi:lipase [Salinisphaera sp.]|uniref:esterase/lipase family protein n=1 Tax=Salinisphaera sp. TaxID=1914330 RepID=UPI000C53001C|nr:lipase [Salinisphaera sp.]MBS64516.1 lipase [Salinisphaera sp.]